MAFILGRPPYDNGTELAVMNADGSHIRVLTRADQGWDTPAQPSWSPDGRTIAVSDGPHLGCLDAGLDGPCISRISLVNVKTGARQATISGVEDPSWSPDGKQLAFDTIYEAPVCGSCPTTPHKIFVGRSDGRGRRRLVRGESPAWSPTAELIAYRTETAGQLHLIRPDGSGDRQVGRYRTFAWSPDGTRFGLTLPCRNDLDICLGTMWVQTGRVIRITHAGYFHGGFAWSADDSRLAWIDSARDGDQLVSAPSSGAAKPREIFRTARDFRIDESSVVFTADGTRILFTVTGPP